jgi:hypothetical protein
MAPRDRERLFLRPRQKEADRVEKPIAEVVGHDRLFGVVEDQVSERPGRENR